jgi:hypothetical protein
MFPRCNICTVAPTSIEGRVTGRTSNTELPCVGQMATARIQDQQDPQGQRQNWAQPAANQNEYGFLK